MTAQQIDGKKPWHQEFYVWMVLFFPTLAIVAGSYTMYLAITTNDGLVVDDYYKQGLEINRTLARDQVAATHGLQSAIQLNPENLKLQVILMKTNEEYPYPAQMSLSIRHRTRSGFDHKILLKQDNGEVYQGQLDTALVPGWWNVQLEADDWRLVGKMRHAMTELWLSAPSVSK